MTISPFTVSRLPEIIFGSGSIRQLASRLRSFGPHILIITGQRSFIDTPAWPTLQAELNTVGITWTWRSVQGEPTPHWVDETVRELHNQNVKAVVGIGGGSPLDAAKAVAGLLPSGHSVMDYLEGVGQGLTYDGPELPFIAVPTTAGTGSEATKNAVLSVQGTEGFKKSFRADALVAQIAIVDPDLLHACPKFLLAANGMDAFTQLLESYVSIKANPFTDALAWSGLEAFVRGFWSAYETELGQPDSGFTDLAYAALQSGITLAQVGLGSVHGLASPLGAFFPIPHGVVCGTLVAEATRVNISALHERHPDSPALTKYAHVGRLLAGNMTLDDKAAQESLVEILSDWTARLGMPTLDSFGYRADDAGRVISNARGGSMKTNPLVLTDEELAHILKARTAQY
ncbi:iron-containing alcohol dehydrogenase [Salinispirillum marinum]|uniref:Iron-containing alcohol dehydrogenase n=2 Tax=Saccharospirillaceae TaxID=255527 RepID=A0ABV8BD99_9GAMM